jgi:hypothetical protein
VLKTNGSLDALDVLKTNGRPCYFLVYALTQNLLAKTGKHSKTWVADIILKKFRPPHTHIYIHRFACIRATDIFFYFYKNKKYIDWQRERRERERI